MFLAWQCASHFSEDSKGNLRARLHFFSICFTRDAVVKELILSLGMSSKMD